MSDYLDPANEELLKDFFSEAEAQVDILEQNLLVLENNPGDSDAVDELFRAAHTLKGAAGTVQMEEIAEFTHVIEDALDVVRGGKARVTDSLVDIVLECVDQLKAMLRRRMEGESVPEAPSDLEQRLADAVGAPSILGDRAGAAEPGQGTVPGGAPDQAGERDASESRASPASDSSAGTGGDAAEVQARDRGESPARRQTAGDATADAAGGELSEYEWLELKDAVGPGESLYRLRIHFDENNPMNTVGGIQAFAALKKLGHVLRTNPTFDELYADVFHPVVDYYVSSAQPRAELERQCTIPDVTRSVSIETMWGASETDAVGQELGSGALAERASGAGRSGAAGDTSGVAAEREPRPDQAQGFGATATPEHAAARDGKEGAPGGGKADVGATGEESSGSGAEGSGSGARSAEQAASDIRRQAGASSILRVDSRRIDQLLNLVSETVILKAGFNQIVNELNDNLNALQESEKAHREQLKQLFEALPKYLEEVQQGAGIKDIRRRIADEFGDVYETFETVENGFKGTIGKYRSMSQNLGRVAGELQEGVMRIRMVPISQIFSRFPRLVRDLTRSLGKKAELTIEGEDTELDKSVIEDLLDPLIHCVRNSIDHGIEEPIERREYGKPETGQLHLSARNEGNMILIEVSDDGRGIDVEAVKERAIARGVIHPSKNLSDVEAFNLIFEPGFSTSQEVSNISGRGVGLDVVKKQIEKLNGSVAVWSERGLGTRLTVKIPLTLAIIQGLLVRVGREMYAIPITSVVDSHRIQPSDIKLIDNYEVFNVREDVISLVRLNRLFRIETDEERDHYFVVVVGSGERRMGIVVDELIGEEDVVIKPLRDHYTNAPGIAGANITGDGTVSLIIDVSQLLELGLTREREARQRLETTIQ